VSAAGSVGLVDQAMNLRLTTLLAKEMSQAFGGNRVSGFLTTALSNSRGELIIPSLVTGTFARPKFAPDPQRVAKMKLEGLRSDPAGVVGGFKGLMDSLRGKKQ
jgi:hypothetical protein